MTKTGKIALWTLGIIAAIAAPVVTWSLLQSKDTMQAKINRKITLVKK